MKIALAGELRFTVPFSQEELDLLVELSAVHYDATCRHASAITAFEPGSNFLRIWHNISKSYTDGPFAGDEFEYSGAKATWRQIDTCLKILEYPAFDRPKNLLALRLSNDLRRALQLATPFVGIWQTEINTIHGEKA